MGFVFLDICVKSSLGVHGKLYSNTFHYYVIPRNGTWISQMQQDEILPNLDNRNISSLEHMTNVLMLLLLA